MRRTVDYVIGRIPESTALGREEYADMFEYAGDLIHSSLSKVGMKPIAEIRGTFKQRLYVPLKESNLQKVRIVLAKQDIKYPNHVNFNWEVYLTEQGHWIVVLGWKKQNEGDVYIIRSREDFLRYFDLIESECLPHPLHWLFDAPHSVVERAATRLAFNHQVMEKLDDLLLHADMRLTMALRNTKDN